MIHPHEGSKSAGQLAYEAARHWVAEHPEASSQTSLPVWESLDVRAREYWNRIGAAVREPLIAAIGAFASEGGRRQTGPEPAYCNLLAAAGLPPESIRGLWHDDAQRSDAARFERGT